MFFFSVGIFHYIRVILSYVSILSIIQISRILNAEGDLEAVKKKFSSSKFGSVATMKIAVLPDDLP